MEIGDKVTIEDICAEIGCHWRTVYNWRERGLLPAPSSRIGKHVVWEPEAIEWDVLRSYFSKYKGSRGGRNDQHREDEQGLVAATTPGAQEDSPESEDTF